MLASEILKRIIPGPTTTAVRAFPGGADVATISAAGQVLAGALACGNITASNVDVASLNAGFLTAFGGALQGFITPEIDCLAAPGTTYAIPGTGIGAGKTFVTANALFAVTDFAAASPTLTTAPVIKIGNNGAHDNFLSASAPATLTNQAKNRRTSCTQTNAFGSNPLPMPSLATDLIAELVTQGAGTSLTVLKARWIFLTSIVDFAP